MGKSPCCSHHATATSVAAYLHDALLEHGTSLVSPTVPETATREPCEPLNKFWPIACGASLAACTCRSLSQPPNAYISKLLPIHLESNLLRNSLQGGIQNLLAGHIGRKTARREIGMENFHTCITAICSQGPLYLLHHFDPTPFC